MKIICPKCKEEQEADEKTAACPKCRSVLRRCVDCAHYDIRVSVCKAVNRPIVMGEAYYPTFSSDSTYCRSYTPGTPAAG